MIRKPRPFVVIVSFTLLIILIVSAPFTLAEDRDEHEADFNFEHAVIAIEASVVKVDLGVLHELMGDRRHHSLASVPLDKIWHCIREEAGEVVTAHHLLVTHNHVGSINAESREEHKHKEQQGGEFGRRETQVSIQARAEVADDKRIGLELEFAFKLIATEEAAEGENISADEHAEEIIIKITSALVLMPGKPRIITAQSDGHVATFLIVGADI